MKQKSSAKGKPAARRGRPTMPEGEALDSYLPKIRCKSDERQSYEEAAAREGLSLSEWVRQTLNRAVKK